MTPTSLHLTPSRRSGARAMDRLESLVLKVVGLLLVAAFAALVMMRLLFRRPIIATRAAV